MPSLFTPSTILAQGTRAAIIGVDVSLGTAIDTRLTDPTDAALTSQATYSFYPPGLETDQEIMSRQVLIGTDDGHVLLSYDSGTTFFSWDLETGVAITVACGEVSSPAYPHAYAGTASGALFAYTEAHGGIALGLWTQVGDTGSAITALTLPTNGYGRVWIGCLDGSLWRYTPSSGLQMMAVLPGAVKEMVHLQDQGVLYGLCSDDTAAFFSAMELSSDVRLFLLDARQTYHALAAAGTRSLAASGETGITWSPDAGSSLGSLPVPSIGPYAALATSWDDHNERYLIAGDHKCYRTLDNGVTWAAGAQDAPTGIEKLLCDPHHPGVLYGMGAGRLVVSADAGTSWDILFGSGIASVALGALVLYSEEMAGSAHVTLLAHVGTAYAGVGVVN